MTKLLSGGGDRLTSTVQFVEADLSATLDALTNWRRGLGQHVSVDGPMTWQQGWERLAPLQTPWTRELLWPCGDWTGYANSGADSTASAVVPARHLSARHLLAQYVPPYGPGHAATQFWLSGPSGEPPMMYVRTLSATSTDGVWHWLAHGSPQPFEDVTRYDSRRIRNRLDGPLLLHYVEALGIKINEAVEQVHLVTQHPKR